MTLEAAAARLAARLAEGLGGRTARKPAVPASALARLALDIVLVEGRIRTATLIDAFAPSGRDCSEIAKALKDCQCTELVLIVFAPADQVFVVNRSCMLQAPDTSDPVYVCVNPAVPIDEILSHIQGACRDRGPAYLLTSSAPGAAKRCMVPACGWLLGYPVIYALREEHAAIASCPLPRSFATDDDWEELATSLTDYIWIA
ncbi:uncharacterized protein MJAP1_003400 [Malassezia japonica]|uniref:Uncharacterized protein n=1 Tax=Malassezia japonica TaxID=223818 RepID=A0AAF0F5T6_9BASI|nr:uncharacterized protein MJAP1_003400 [Malassezia japonica]WFD40414.1 hypothetical protein MJAP1_003400 [Malassezia japonica]